MSDNHYIDQQLDEFYHRANQKCLKLPFEFKFNLDLPELDNNNLQLEKPKTKKKHKLIQNSHQSYQAKNNSALF